MRSDAFIQAWVALLEETSRDGRPVVFGRADNLVAWVDWGDGMLAIGAISVVGLALTLIPTLLLTRKYLKV